VQVSGYPTLKFYPGNDKKNPVKYDGTRQADGIVDWLKKNAKHAEWASQEL